ncbi:regulatory particle non-ATPase, partial [Ascosphaera atra]
MSGVQELKSLVSQLHQSLERKQFDNANTLLSKTKRTLLLTDALIPTPATSPEVLGLARESLELGALITISQQDADGFRR